MAIVNVGLHSSRFLSFFLMYVGPEVLLPVTSALAALAGLALMFWNKFVGFCRGTWRLVFRRKS